MFRFDLQILSAVYQKEVPIEVICLYNFVIDTIKLHQSSIDMVICGKWDA